MTSSAMTALSANYANTARSITRIGQAQVITKRESTHEPTGWTMAASSATVEEEQLARTGLHPDGSKSVTCPKRVWRPKVKYQYEEVDLKFDTNEDMDWLFEQGGKCVAKTTVELAPRTDIEEFDRAKHEQTFQENIQWRDCPPEHQAVIEQILKEHWDVFNPENMQNQIRGYQFTIDTGRHPPIKCPTPRYGPHEARVINRLVDELENKGLVEDDKGPYGALVVLASKPNQGHVHWTKYIFRLCVSFRPLNAITRGFEYPVTRCDDAVTDVGPRPYIITGDLKAGYWQVRIHKDSKEKTGFFIPDGKKHWNVMPMGARNAHAFFVAMTAELRKKWTKDYGEKGQELIAHVIRLYNTVTPDEFNDRIKELKTKNPDVDFTLGDPMSVAIVDDILWAAHTILSLLAFFKQSLTVFQHYNVTFNLKKCRFLPTRAEFVGVDLLAHGNTPAEAKYEAIRNLTPPHLFSDLLLFIGLLGFYSKWLPWYEVRIVRWRAHLKQRPIKSDDKEAEAALLKELWTNEDTALFNALKEEILSGPVLQRPDFNRRFYLKTDWSSLGIGGALTQPDCNPDEEEAMAREIEGGTCQLEKSISGLRLRPVEFAARTCKGTEVDMHSAVGEALAGRFLFNKYKRYLWHQEFTWVTDCKANETFFEQELMPTHIQQRWKMDMLRYPFTCVHRPERMMFESNLLSRYNLFADKYRSQHKSTPKHKESTPTGMLSALARYITHQKQAHMIPKSNVIPEVVGQGTARTFLASLCDRGRNTWIVGSGATTIRTAFNEANINTYGVTQIELDEQWQNITGHDNWTATQRRLEYDQRIGCDWLIVSRADDIDSTNEDTYIEIINTARRRGARAIIMTWTNYDISKRHYISKWTTTLKDLNEEQPHEQWATTKWKLQNSKHGGYIEHTTMAIIAAPTGVIDRIQKIEGTMDPTCIRDKMDPANSNYDDYFESSRPEPGKSPGQPQQWEAAIKYNVHIRHQGSESRHPVYNIDYPAPKLTNQANHVGEAPFLIETNDGWLPRTGRVIRRRELLRIVGYNEEEVESLASSKEWPTVSQRIRTTIPKEIMVSLGIQLQVAEEEHMDNLVETKTMQTEQPKAQPYQSYLGTGPGTATETNTDTAFLAAITTRSQRPVPDDRPGEINPINKELEKRGTHNIQEAIIQIQTEETNTDPTEKRRQAQSRVINRWTTIPVPTDKEWRTESQKDKDTQAILKRLAKNEPVQYSDVRNKKYCDATSKGLVEEQQGILYYLEEPRLQRIRQLRRRIVPVGLRQQIFIAFHATPLAGHVGTYKTYWRIATRYWWPGMYTYVKTMVASCGHCVVGKTVSHKAQQILKAISTDEPFDVIAIDIWHPGTTQKMNSLTVKELLEELENATITSLCTTTGYATTANLRKVNGTTVTQTIFTQIFVPNGIPKLVLIDQDSVFKGVLTQFCELLGVKYYVCAPEEHDAILCERFHRFLNGVMKLIGTDTQSLEQTITNVALATYAWNASTIDGTPVVRSFAAKARTFRFPIETTDDDNVVRIPAGQGEATLQHIETTFPLWFQQKEILKLLLKDQRERHLEMKNSKRTPRIFNTGDIVIVRKQVKSSAIEGRPEKLVVKARGPYRVLESAGTASYWVQKLPATQKVKRRQGKKHKEAAWRMTKIPSALVIHKRMDSMDTRYVHSNQSYVNNPLEHNLGIFDFGKYHQAPPHAEHAFNEARQLWQEELEDTSDDSAYEEEDIDPDETQRHHNINNNEPTTTRRRRRRQDTADDNPDVPIVRIQVTVVKTRRQKLEQFWKATQKSTDKLCFVRRHEAGKPLGEWHLVQI